jgi:antitoxin MazE
VDTGIRTRIVKIGDSQGICIPKPLLEQSGIKAEVEIEVQADRLIIRAVSQSRSDWEAAFAAMAQGDVGLLDAPTATDWDETEWEWR